MRMPKERQYEKIEDKIKGACCQAIGDNMMVQQ